MIITIVAIQLNPFIHIDGNIQSDFTAKQEDFSFYFVYFIILLLLLSVFLLILFEIQREKDGEACDGYTVNMHKRLKKNWFHFLTLTLSYLFCVPYTVTFYFYIFELSCYLNFDLQIMVKFYWFVVLFSHLIEQ